MRWVDYILEDTSLPEFFTIFTTSYHVAFITFWEQNDCFKVEQKAISKSRSFDNLLFQSGASVISKWGRCSYFKLGQSLFQSGTKVISKWGSYFKVRQNVISKRGSYFKARQLFKMEHNTCSICVNVQVRSN